MKAQLAVAGPVQVACLVGRAEADQVQILVLPLTSRHAQRAVGVTAARCSVTVRRSSSLQAVLSGSRTWALRDGAAHGEHTASRQICIQGKAWSMGREQPVCVRRVKGVGGETRVEKNLVGTRAGKSLK